MTPSEAHPTNDVGLLGVRYFEQVTSLLDQIIPNQEPQISEAADLVADAILSGRRLLLFGSGHSSMLAMEGHYRAGGLAAVTPILVPKLMLHESAVEGTRLERLPGAGRTILDPYRPVSGEVLVVFSTSGMNSAPVEVAQAAKEAGLAVIAVTSVPCSIALEPHPGTPRLVDVADLVLDNGVPPGDALVTIPGSDLRCGPGSTVTGAVLLNMVLVSAIGRVVAAGGAADVYRSANVPGAAAHNDTLIERYRSANPHL
jgi:uncharacterized phosphosugar-binding protein